MMIDRASKLRWRRKFRRRYRQVEGMGAQAEDQLERHLFRRLSRLFVVRRFVIGWVLFMSLLVAGSVVQLLALTKYYQELKPAAGGTFTEGLVGIFTNANPLYATSPADSAVSNLVFSGLMKYDQDNKLVGDIAEKLSADEQSTTYTVTLRSDVFWHDGKPLTSDDVLYTYQTIQNPDARSPLFSSWSGVKLSAPDARTIVFELPSSLAAFPHALTNGIVPKHILSNTPVEQLRTDKFNSVTPVGSGPFKWDALEVIGADQETREERIGLVPHTQYHGSQAKLQRFVIRTFRNEDLMIERYRNGELTSMAGLRGLPDTLKEEADVYEYDVPLTGATMVFFKTSQPPLDDVRVRRALVQAVSTNQVIKSLPYTAIPVRSPLLTGQLAFEKDLIQLEPNLNAAQQVLDEAGWKMAEDGLRKKDGLPLSFRLHAQSTGEYAAVTKELQEAWRVLGVKVEVFLQEDADIQNTVSRHEYDAVLYGISIGADPDVFAYWHSSQTKAGSGRLNFSEYRSTKADDALEAGRTRTDASTRVVKYKPFLEAWRDDAPALALYQPRFLYVTRSEIHGFNPKSLNSGIDRFANVENWMIRKEKVNK